MELWDAYNARFERLEGVTLVRGQPVPPGMYHLVCDVLVRHTDGAYLLTQRDPGKPFGGLWEASCGGSALKGESPDACAARELWEETGIEAEDLRSLGVITRRDTIYVEYLCVTDRPRDAVRLQPGETCAFRWVSAEALKAMGPGELVTNRIQAFIDDLRPEQT